jgi:Bifunctional DNA primase/polymerase, N-terminal
MMSPPIAALSIRDTAETLSLFTALLPYADMGAAPCPIPAGGKSPVGCIASFVHDWSRDPVQWDAWSREFPGCNWIMVAGPSGKIVVDIDVKKVSREAAWQAWAAWCASHDLPVYAPQVQTPSAGWHCYFDAPANCDSAALRQPALVATIIDIRAGNGFVSPSNVEGKPYIWLT